MAKAIIIKNQKDKKLLHLTQISLFFKVVKGDNGQRTTFYFDDCISVDNKIEAQKLQQPGDLIINQGDYFYEGKILPYSGKHLKQVIEELRFDEKAVTTRQTEDMNLPYNKEYKHFFGLASGWKAMLHCTKNHYDTITLYDINQRQLDFAQKIHNMPSLPNTLQIDWPYTHEFDPPQEVKDLWSNWHKLKINFEQIDILQMKKFPDKSLIWISNIFHFPISIFNHGYEELKMLRRKFIHTNKQSVVYDDKGLVID